PYFVDVVPPLATCGRGSPTGVVWHKHTAWPEAQRGLLVADWTFGKVWRLRPGALDKTEPFITADGDQGFAPTALAVHPGTGELFITIGGRGTRGAVYRVRWLDARPGKELPVADDYGVEWKDEFKTLLPKRARDARTTEERARALVEIRRHASRFQQEALVS